MHTSRITKPNLSRWLVAFSVVAASTTGFAEAERPATVPTQEVTAQDQSTRPADEEVTRTIRQELMKKDFSVAAKNVTIITTNGVVTLKGNVPTAQEKKSIYEIARKVAGQTLTVHNELAVNR